MRIIFLIAIVFIVGLLWFGIKIDAKLEGPQPNLKFEQKYDLETSHFYRKYFSGDSLLVLNIWATWCKPCIKEMPMLNEVKRHYQGKNIAFISFSLDEDPEKIRDFIVTKKFEFLDITLQNHSYRTAIMNILRGKKPEEWIGAYSLPMTFIIKGGIVRESVNGIVEKDELIEMIDKYK